ncbi:hypothetical protein ANO11243_077940 [Dothideomycetidae sp. 11243]|nr:hypothetical protein ANO11243_077940 [fungal sp. No.11243]
MRSRGTSSRDLDYDHVLKNQNYAMKSTYQSTLRRRVAACTMQENEGPNGNSPSTGKKRMPKACGSCRQSKVRCDEVRPACGRCHSMQKACVYAERPKTAEEIRIQELEDEVMLLRQQLQTYAAQNM